MGIIGFGILLLFGYLIYKSWENHQRQQEGNNEANYVSKKDRSLEILRERLAKGEISEDEYERLKKKLLS